MQNFYQNTFVAPKIVVAQLKEAKHRYTNSPYSTVNSLFIDMKQINNKGNFEFFENDCSYDSLYFGELIQWLNVSDDDVDDQEDWYENKPRQSYPEKACYREWCFIKYLFGEINVIEES